MEEGLAGLMYKVVDSSLFSRFIVNIMVEYNILHCVDDTITMGIGSWRNLWGIEILLRAYGLVYGLNVNFFKRRLYGLNIPQDFMYVIQNSSFVVWIQYLSNSLVFMLNQTIGEWKLGN